MKNLKDSEAQVMSYYYVRQALGYIGIALPITLILGGIILKGDICLDTYSSKNIICPSISDFFHTPLREFFVGALCAIGVFLYAYKGYAKDKGEFISDKALARLAGIAAIGVALFPNAISVPGFETITQKLITPDGARFAHYGSALIFFLCLAVFCFCKFTKSQDHRRNRIYKICGWVILLSTAGFAMVVLLKGFLGDIFTEIIIYHDIIFWLEAIGVWAFAISWLTKGKADISLINGFGRIIGRQN